MYAHQDLLRSALSEETLSLVCTSAIETSSIKTSILRTGENLVDVEARTVSFHCSIFRHCRFSIQGRPNTISCYKYIYLLRFKLPLKIA